VTGTGGVLLAAKEAGLVTEIRPILDALREQYQFRLGDAPYERLLRAAGED
jgi:predicted nucleic acid-binding protein